MSVIISSGNIIRDSMLKSLFAMSAVRGNIVVCSDNNTDIIGIDCDLAVIITCGNPSDLTSVPTGVKTVILKEPFLLEEILSVVMSIPYPGASPEVSDAEYSNDRRILTCGDSSVTLSRKEAELFLLLLSCRSEPLSLSTVYDRIWPDSRDTNVAGVYFTYLRRKLTELFGEGAVINVRHKGYMLRRDILDINIVS